MGKIDINEIMKRNQTLVLEFPRVIDNYVRLIKASS